MDSEIELLEDYTPKENEAECNGCDGFGQTDGVRCDLCEGTGRVEVSI